MTTKPITLDWSRFDRLTDARNAFRKAACIYIQTDRVGRIIRVGKAQKGLEARYRGGTGYAIDAAMHDSGNFVFVAAVPSQFCSTIELQLIWELRSQLEYNNQGKLRQPSTTLRLRHSGDAPLFVAS